MNQRVKRRETLLLLYSLERKWGVSADLYKVGLVAPNLELGRTGEQATKYPFTKFITHGVTIELKFEYDIGYLAANKNFTYGGIFMPNDRLAIIRNIFNLKSIDMKDYIIYDGKKYAMQTVVDLDYHTGWILHLRHTPGSKAYQQHDRTVWSRVTATQDIATG